MLLYCDPHESTDFRFSFNALNKVLARSNVEINDNDSDCSSKNLRKRKVFVHDERDFLNTELFLPVHIQEIDDLIDDINANHEVVNPREDNLKLNDSNLDKIKEDYESLDEVDNDNDNDSKRDDKDNDDNKDSDDDTINTNNDERDDNDDNNGDDNNVEENNDDDDKWKEKIHDDDDDDD